MQIKEVDVEKTEIFSIGRQYSHNVLVIHFVNLPNLKNKYIYYKIDDIEEEIPLVSDLFIVSRPLTMHSGKVKAQIIVRDEANETIDLTKNFTMIIKASNYSGIGEDENYPDDLNVKNYFVKIDEKVNSFEELANLVQTKLDNGEFIGAQGPKGDPGDVTEEYRNLAMQITQNASDAQTSATNAQVSATAARKSLDDAKEFANQTKSEMNQIKNDTELLKNEANTSAVNAKASENKAKEYADKLQISTDDISQLKEDLVYQKKVINELNDKKITKFYASNQGEIHITDSDNGKIQDMMIYGKSSQDGTPSPENPVEINSVVNPVVKVYGANIMQLNDAVEITDAISGITVSCKDGVIKAKGTALKKHSISLNGRSGIIVLKSIKLQNGKTYIFNPNPIKGAESVGCCLDFTNTRNLGISFANGKINKPFKLTDLQGQFSFFLNINVEQGTVVDIEWKPQLLLNEVLLPYEPYKEQAIQLPITLNAIPVSSSGNITINGQQYIADYVDVERGKLVRMVDSSKLDNTQSIIDKTEWLLVEQQETDLTIEQTQALKELATYYPVTNITVGSEQLDGYTVFNYPISLADGWNYVKQQLNDNRDYIYDMDLQSAEAYVNSEYAVTLTELGV